LELAVLQRLSLTGIFVQGEKEGEEDTDGEENPQQSIPGQPSLAGNPPENHRNNVGEAKGIGGSEQHLVGCPAEDSFRIGSQAQMKKQIGQGRQYKCNFFPYCTHIMNKTIACVFPETLPDERLLFPLVQVFDQVVHMQAIENTPPEQGTETVFIEQCRQRGRLQGFTPAPLGEQRDRFRALVQDMRRRGDAYTSQLSMLTLAGLNRRNHPESHHSILSDLLQRSDIKEQQETELVLWQSRLIVTLGEFFDIEQAELNRALHEITHRQDTLLADLCEEEENPFVLPVTAQDTGHETDGILRHRLKAWTRLCFYDGRPVPGLLVTRHRMAMDLLQEVYEKRHRQSVRHLARLEVPVTRTVPGQDANLDEPLIRQSPSLGKVLAELAANASGLQREGEMQQLVQAGLAEWSHCVAGLFSSAPTERCVLDLVLFPETTAPRLFAESFDGGTRSDKQGDKASTVGCVVGLLERD